MAVFELDAMGGHGDNLKRKPADVGQGVSICNSCSSLHMYQIFKKRRLTFR